MERTHGRFVALALITGIGCSGSISPEAPRDTADMLAAVSGAVASGSAGSGAWQPSGGSVAPGAPGLRPPTAAGSTGASAAMPALGSTSLNLIGAPQYSRFVRLTNEQWAQSVRDVFGIMQTDTLASGFQSPVSGTTDFTNNELVLSVDQRAAADFQAAAESVASLVIASSDALSRVYPGSDAEGFVTTLGRRLYRRPLTGAELATYLALFNQAEAEPTRFTKGAGLVIRGMLQSPHFLYRTELGPVGMPLTGYEVAAKLSLWLRGTTPNDALLDAAASGQLDSPDGVATLAGTLLQEPAALAVLRKFHGELYDFDRYANISKLGVADYDPALNQEYVETSRLFFDKLFSQNLGVLALLTSTRGFVGPRMAALYGVAPPTHGYEERELGPQRVGYFSQIPFLSLHGLNGEPDSIHRGVSMNLDVLCTVLGPPAPDLPPIPALQPGQTNRERISKLTEGCGGVCHNQQINPLGFAFEHFDGMGRWREMEGGSLPVVSRGMFMFSEGSVAFEGAAELMQALAAGRQSHRCYAKKLASFGMQRDIVDADLPLLDAMTQVSMDNGSIKQVILALVRNEAFRIRTGGGQ